MTPVAHLPPRPKEIHENCPEYAFCLKPNCTRITKEVKTFACKTRAQTRKEQMLEPIIEEEMEDESTKEPEKGIQSDEDEEDINEKIVRIWSKDRLVKSQNETEMIPEIIKLIEEGKDPPTLKQRQGLNREEKRLLTEWHNLTVEDSLLTRSKKGIKQTYVPEELREELIHFIHGSKMSCHFGREKTSSHLKSRFYWPGITKDCSEFIKRCEICARTKSSKRKKAPLEPIKSAYFGNRLNADLAGPFPEVDGFKYVLVMIDHFTSWTEIVPLKTMEAKEVAEGIFSYIARYGAMEILTTDQGLSFLNEIIRHLTETFEVEMAHTAAYNPKADGKSERQIKTIKGLILSLMADTGKNWLELIPSVLMIILPIRNGIWLQNEITD